MPKLSGDREFREPGRSDGIWAVVGLPRGSPLVL
jgi:hypothetical protein